MLLIPKAAIRCGVLLTLDLDYGSEAKICFEMFDALCSLNQRSVLK